MNDRELAEEEHEAWRNLSHERRREYSTIDVFWREKDPTRTGYGVAQRHAVWGHRSDGADPVYEPLWIEMERNGMTLKMAADIAIEHRKSKGTLESAIARCRAGKSPRSYPDGRVVWAASRKGKNAVDKTIDTLLSEEPAPNTPRVPTDPAPPPSEPPVSVPPVSIPPVSALPESLEDEDAREEPNGGAWWAVRMLIEQLARRATWGLEPKEAEPLLTHFIIDAKELVSTLRRKLHQRGDIGVTQRQIKSACQFLNIAQPRKSGMPVDLAAARKNAKQMRYAYHEDRVGKEAYDPKLYLTIGVALAHIEQYNQMLGETT